MALSAADAQLVRGPVPERALRWVRKATGGEVERCVPLAQVRDLLGHASITTTEATTTKLENLQIAAAKLESGLTFEPFAPDSPVADADPRARKT